jgi:hypothetical protein
MEIKVEIIGKWKVITEKYEFFDENLQKIHPDQISVDSLIEMVIDGQNITAQESGEEPTQATYEIHQELLDYYIVQFSGTETIVSNLKLIGNNMLWITDVEGMKFNSNGIWHTAPKSVHTLELARA